ncbi:MAG: polymer-forming cytoskeletal protein [Pseudorhodobacter sp.]
MFSKSRINEPGPKADGDNKARPQDGQSPKAQEQSAAGSKGKPAASVLSSDLTITGNVRTTGDIQVEGTVEGDIRAHLLTVGESATIRGEIVADDIVVNGRVIGRVRGLKVRLAASARVEGDIIHKTIAIESGAHFEGSVQRQDDPLSNGRPAVASTPAAASSNPAPAAAATTATPAPAAKPAATGSGN